MSRKRQRQHKEIKSSLSSPAAAVATSGGSDFSGGLHQQQQAAAAAAAAEEEEAEVVEAVLGAELEEVLGAGHADGTHPVELRPRSELPRRSELPP